MPWGCLAFLKKHLLGRFFAKYKTSPATPAPAEAYIKLPDSPLSVSDEAPQESDDPDDELSDTSSFCGSLTSTIQYEHEPFATFQIRALALAREKLWPDMDPELISVERLEGGSFNRIIGLRGDDEYILRIPRGEAGDLRRDVAALTFCSRYTDLSVPSVTTYDATGDNVLGKPYMIQNRLQGESLLSYPEMSHENKCRVARDVGRTIRDMLNTKSRNAGFLGPSPDTTSLSVIPFQPKEPAPAGAPYLNSESAVSAGDLMMDLFQCQKAALESSGRLNAVNQKEIDDWCTMTRELMEGGWLENISNCLAHLDFEPRNMLVEVDSPADQPIVSGILDWDSAVLVPSFLCCRPAFWLWTDWDDEDMDDEDERIAGDDPRTDEERELKRIFEDAAGPDYLRFAYGTPYRLARGLLTCAIQPLPLRSNEDFEASLVMMEEWVEFMKGQGKASNLKPFPSKKNRK